MNIVIFDLNKRIQLLSVNDVPHPYLNTGEAHGVRTINTRSLQLNENAASLL